MLDQLDSDTLRDWFLERQSPIQVTKEESIKPVYLGSSIRQPSTISIRNSDRVKHKTFKNLNSKIYQKESKILDQIFPKKIFVKNNQLYEAKVSFVPANLTKLISIENELYTKLQASKAKEIGICQTRRTIFSRFLDELIRQELIVSSGRGLLLMYLKLELEDQLNSYQRALSSSLNYGIRKACSLDKRKLELQNKKVDLMVKIKNKAANIKDKSEFLNTQAQPSGKKKYEVLKEFQDKISENKKMLQTYKLKIEEMISNTDHE